MFTYALTRDYSRDDDEDWEVEEEEEEEVEEVEEGEEGNEVLPGPTGGENEGTPNNIPPGPKVSLRFKEVRHIHHYSLLSLTSH